MKKLFLLLIVTLCLGSCQKKKSEISIAGTDFHSWAPTPPMGWNSWDCYGPTVTEPEVKNNADYMAEHLKEYGWEYIVVDIRWYVENDKSGGYNEKDPVFSLDGYGRFTPAINKFPSSKDGKGFKPLADYIHDKGLKFGIHMMRGIPVVAVEKNTPIYGSDATAGDIYSPEGQCVWLHDMFTVVAEKNGAQEYYNSLFQLYAEWGIDLVKFDDLSGRTSEIEMIRKAIDKCGRPIVISISPGGDKPESVEFLKNNVNMWRTSNDFWDNWPQLKNQFTILKQWAGLGITGSYPDGDMLPLGRIGLRAERGEPRWSGFTRDEQYTLMTLFAIFKSPLMFGGDLPNNDDFTLSLLTNKDVIYVNQHSENGREMSRENDLITWTADDPKTGDKFLALFNASDMQPVVESKALWKSRQITSAETDQSIPVDIDITGAKKLYLVVISEDISGFSNHNCNWINPEITVNGKIVKLTDTKWVKGSSSRGIPLLNRTRTGEGLKINDQEYSNGINVNALSIIEFELPEGAARFKALAGLQSGVASVTDAVRQNNGKFLVFTEDPSGPEPADATDITVELGNIGLTGKYTITDLWTGENLGKYTGSFSRTIPRHGAGLFRVH